MEYGYITMKSGKGYLQKRTPAFRDSPYFCCPELPGFVENFRRKRKKFFGFLYRSFRWEDTGCGSGKNLVHKEEESAIMEKR